MLESQTSAPVLEQLGTFPDSARAWLYAADRNLLPHEQQAVLQHLEKTVTHWKSHGTVIPAAARFLDDATLVVVADFTGAELSGCSIDRMVSAVRDAGEPLGVNLVDNLGVHYWGEQGFAFASRKAFADMVAEGVTTPETFVLDLTLMTLGEVRNGKWKRPMKETWHRRAFKLAPSA
jgi:hypothetical protein